MSQDERGPLPVDDGEIHEWLDGELNATRAAELEAFTHSSPEFAQRVAEARGLIAASSRILGALDEVPAGVLPDASVPPFVGALTPSKAPSRRANRWSLRRVSSIAALLMVGVTGVVIARREPAVSESELLVRAESSSPALADSSPVPLSASAPEASTSASVPTVATAPAVAANESVRAPSRAAAPAPVARDLRDAAAPRPRVASPVPPNAVASSVPADAFLPTPVAAAAKASGLPVAQASARRTAQLTMDSQAAVQQSARQGERTMQLRATPSIQGAARFSFGSVFSASDAFSGDAVGNAEIQSDVLPVDLLLGVQRVQCAPNCVQLRIEVARDGRLRRWMQSLGSATIADTSTLNAETLAALAERVTAMQLDTLPAVLRLDGSKCRTVGSLRESLRVSFVHNNAPRQVMGLPWCTDGSHVLDRAAQVIEEAATKQLGLVSR